MVTRDALVWYVVLLLFVASVGFFLSQLFYGGRYWIAGVVDLAAAMVVYGALKLWDNREVK